MVRRMTFRVIFTVSQSLNFLGYARNYLPRDVVDLCSRETEAMFARDEPPDIILSQITDQIGEIVTPYLSSFMEKWPSIREELLRYRDRLERIWGSCSQDVQNLMDELAFFYSGSIQVFPVMPFFREWPRSNPLSMPANPWTDKEILEFLVHEILHRTTEVDHPKSLWHYLGMLFIMRKVNREQRFLIQHALIYVASSWIASHALKEEFTIMKLIRREFDLERCIEMEHYMHSIFAVFSSMERKEERNPVALAEEIAACCIP